MHSGHGGSDQVAKAIESSADQLAFLFQTLEVTPGPPLVPAIRRSEMSSGDRTRVL